MVNTGQGLVLGALTGSWPQLDLLLAGEPTSRSLFLFSGCWRLPWLPVCVDIWDWVFSPLLWLEGWIFLLVPCGSLAGRSGGGWDSVRGLVIQWCVVALPGEPLVCFWSWGCVCSSGWGSTWTWTLLWSSVWTSELFVSFWTSDCGWVALPTDQILATNGVLGVLGLKNMAGLGWRLMGGLRWRRMGILGWGFC